MATYKSLERIYAQFGASEKWIYFDAPIRRLPAGTNYIVVGVALLVKADGRAFFSDVRLNEEPLRLDFSPGELTHSAPPCFSLGRSWLEQHVGAGASGAAARSNPLACCPPASTTIRRSRVARRIRGLGINSLAGWHSVQRWGALKDTPGDQALRGIRALKTATTRARPEQSRLDLNHAYVQSP